MARNDPIKTYDARWETSDFTSEEIHRFVESVLIYARELAVDTITLCRDARLGSASVMEMILKLALESGYAVFLCANPVGTTQSYFISAWVSKSHSRTMGLTVTASHNPASYTGLKVTVPTVQAIGLGCGPLGGFSRIREIYHSRKRLTGKSRGKLFIVDLTDEYVEYCMQNAGISENGLKGLHVVLDAMNGSAGPEICTALQRCGTDVEPLRLIPDGTFPTGSPNPTSRGKMAQAISLCRQKEKVFIIGTDGDGDRLVFGDSRGILNAGFVALPILRSVIGSLGNARQGKVVYDPKVNPLALQAWGQLNIEPVLFRNGHSQIKQFMRQIQAVAAVEESGHYYHKMALAGLTVYCENSILTILLLLKTIKEEPGSFDRLWRNQEQLHSTGELNFQLEDDLARDAAMEELIGWFKADHAQVASTTGDGIDLQGTVVRTGIRFDGSRVELAADWYSGYIRKATNEKAVLRFYLSAANRDRGREIELAAREILKKFEAVEVG